MSYLPYGRQIIEDDDIAAVVAVLKSDYLTTGPTIAEFEREICAATGAKYAVAVSNGTAALHAACFAAGVKAGDEVVTSPITFAASANCALYMGAKPVFADIDEKTYNIDPACVEAALTRKTAAIIPVHYTGQPCDMDAVNAAAKKRDIPVIADGAHALGAVYKGRKLGELADMTTLSFHPVKHVTTGEGGAIITDNEEYYKKLLLFRSHGITRDPAQMLANEGGWYYEQLELGYNYRMTDIQAALGVSQIKKLGRFVKRRREIAALYNEGLRDIPCVTLPFQAECCENSWHLYVVRFDKDIRGKIYAALQAEGIGVNVHYIPVYRHPYYRKLGYEKGLCPRAEALYEGMISLPMWAGMADDDVYRVINTIKGYI
jgi:UDP-4-amino-4,6-dideoxy-N-acetyl-beta-L-altrosamine transaminase